MEMGTFEILILTSGVLSETVFPLITFRFDPNILLATTREVRVTGEFQIQCLSEIFSMVRPMGINSTLASLHTDLSSWK